MTMNGKGSNQNVGKQRLVVEIVAAHNLMPKDGEGSSSPFVEVEMDKQRLRTQVKPKDLNPIWNEKLCFHITDPTHVPYTTLDLSVFNERSFSSTNTRDFLGRVRVSGSTVADDASLATPQLHSLQKRSLFSHVRGEITLRLYFEGVVNGGSGLGGGGLGLGLHSGETRKMKNNKNSASKQQKIQNQQVRILQENNVNNSNNNVNNNNNNNKGVSLINFGGGGFSKPAAGVEETMMMMKPPPPPAMMSIPPPPGRGEFSLKETKPQLGGEPMKKDKTSSTYDLVEQVQYLYVRVVKANDIPGNSNELYAEVKLGNYRGITAKKGPEWDQVFAFSKDCIQSSAAEVAVVRKEGGEPLGRVWFDLGEVPRRVPPDSQLAPQWYRLDPKGELMVAVWFGTQADEAFAEAWHSKAAAVNLDGLSSIKSKVYLSPKLWYLRVSVIEAQDLAGSVAMAGMRFPELYAKVHVGNMLLKTRVAAPSPARSPSNPYWNDEMMFVVGEPFEDFVTVVVEDRGEVLGRVVVPVAAIEKRINEKMVQSRWFNLGDGNNNSNNNKLFGSRLHMRVSLDGGYHVLDEATSFSSDVRPTEKHLWKPRVGVLEMGILGATGLVPVKIKEGRGGSTDAYCVAKYGPKWVRTRTIVDNLSPKWNEQYTWEVFDPCTVVTVGVFDNSRVEKGNGGNMNRDSRIGKVRVRLSTLETDRVYTHSYPLLVLHPTGVKKMGEIHLAVRFSCTNMANMLNMYATPLLPKMHYAYPLGVAQIEQLRHQAASVVALRLGRAEPPLGREVVDYMLDNDSNLWSMRRSKANFFRLVNVLSGLAAAVRWVEAVRGWHRPVGSALFVVFFLGLVAYPELIVPASLLYMGLLGLWRYRARPRHPAHMDTRLSNAESVFPDELDEEFDTFPTSRAADVVRMRYDRLRSVAGRIQTVVGDMASQGERFQALISWRDPRASFLFVVLCLVAAVGFYAVPLRVVVALWGLYVLRPPRFRTKLPSRALSFFRRLPTRADSML